MKAKTKSKRGGKREGAGRKALDGAENVRPRKALLDDETVRKAKLIGGGEMSAGIRLAFKSMKI